MHRYLQSPVIEKKIFEIIICFVKWKLGFCKYRKMPDHVKSFWSNSVVVEKFESIAVKSLGHLKWFHLNKANLVTWT